MIHKDFRRYQGHPLPHDQVQPWENMKKCSKNTLPEVLHIKLLSCLHLISNALNGGNIN